MTPFRLLLRNLLYHRRGNFAVFLGVALGTAVLTGALLVGDSLRGSLRELTLDQLGWVHYAMPANRLFREQLALEIDERQDASVRPPRPVLLLQGSAGRLPTKDEPKSGMVSKVAIYGVETEFWPTEQVPLSADFWQSPRFHDGVAVPGTLPGDEVVLNASLADALQVKAGDKVVLRLQKTDAVPRETLLGKRKQEDVVDALEIQVRAVLPDHGLARFTLQASPEPVRNAFLPLHFLQRKLGLGDHVNLLLASDQPGSEHRTTQDWDERVKKHLTLEDWNLTLRSPAQRARALVHFLDPRSRDGNLKPLAGFGGGWLGRVPEELAEKADPTTRILAGKDIEAFYQTQRGYFLLESKRMLLEDAVVQAMRHTFAGKDEGIPAGRIQLASQPWWLCPTFIYLADSIADKKAEISYAVIAAQGALPGDKEAPLGKDEIDLASWPGSPLIGKPGDVVTVSYYAPDDHNHLQMLKTAFKVRKIFSLKGRYDDPDLVPDFPGITDKLDMENWSQDSLPFPYNTKRGAKEESYWKRYRTTPRAYVSLDTAQKLWGSRFGNLTSYRVLPLGEVNDYQAAMDDFAHRLLAGLDPKAGGFVWQDVRARGLTAGGGSTDFGEYFFYFSFFLIVAALLLVGLLFRLNLDLRGREIGILLATGWTFPQVRRLLLGEGGLLAILGGLVGLAGALGYAALLLRYLGENWPGEQKLQFLHLHVGWQSLVIGFAASVAVSFLTILWAVRILARMSPTRLLAGETTAGSADNGTSVSRRGRWLAGGCLLAAAACLVSGFFVQGNEAQAGSFFGSGFLLLVAALSMVWRTLRSSGERSNPRQSLFGLALRNASRHAVRSVLTVGLLASAIFLIVAVEAFHKTAGHDFFAKTGGSGGFTYIGQTDVPIFQDLNSPAVRSDLKFPADAGSLPMQAKFFACRVLAGDDTSCLNLYQPTRPKILGVPRTLIERGGFSFAALNQETGAQFTHPWLLLTETARDGTVPIFVDATSAQYILKKKLGDILEVPGESDQPVRLRIVGLFDESVFQSELVMAESHFCRLFPHQEGFSFFLIECPADPEGKIRAAWHSALADSGLSIQTTASRLERFLAVENTYLATFQALGALGLMLGAVGLAIVLLRSVWERRAELALMRALGFTRMRLAWLVLAENTVLLVVGLLVGTAAALLSVAPQLFSGAASLLSLRVLDLLGIVAGVGLVAGVLAVSATLRAPLLQALRRE